MNVTGGTFTVMQEYIYEHDAVVIQAGTMRFSGVQFQSSGQSWSNAFTDSARYILEDCEISDGFITTGFLGGSKGSINNTQMPGEFLCFGSNNLEITNSDLLLMWLVLPDSSVVESMLPNDSLVTDWDFSTAEPDVDGIPYSVQIDSCTNVMWGLISISGSEAVFRDTEFRTIGLMFQKPDSIVVNNITNESRHTDEIIDIPDRRLRLINSHVHTWSFYATSNSNITIQNCVFGELLSQDSSQVLVTNSVCDGTGGYLGAFHHSFTLIVGSLIKSQVISRNSGVLVGAGSVFWGTEIDADESSIMFIANTATAVEPEAHNSAIIFEAQCPPVGGLIDDFVPIFGTARLLKGPENPIRFYGYKIECSSNLENPDWQRIGFFSNSVKDDTLAVWDTHDLAAENYALQLSLFHSFGDSISMDFMARLDCQTDIREMDKNIASIFYLAQNYPNPFNVSTTIRFGLSHSSVVILKIFDVRGKEVVTLIDRELQRGTHEIVFDAGDLPGGVYFYKLLGNGSFKMANKMLFLK